MPRKALPSLSMTFSDCFISSPQKRRTNSRRPSIKEEEMMSLIVSHQPRMRAGGAARMLWSRSPWCAPQ
jgi:hypothetical protein